MTFVKPFFSIIIPMFNTEKFIGECIASILNQNFNDYEVIIVDDGSTDESVRIVSKYIKDKSNIKLICQKNSGVSSARNSALKLASGKYVVFMDSDDYLIDGSMLKLKQVLLDNNNVDILFFGYYDDLPNGFKKHFVHKKFLGKEISKDNAIEGIFSDVGGFCWNKVYRHSIMLNSKFDNKITFLEDMLFNVSLVMNSNRIMGIEDTLYVYRWRQESTVNTFNYKSMTFFTSLDKIEKKVPQKFKQIIDMKRKMAAIEFASNLIFKNRKEYLKLKTKYKEKGRLNKITKFNISKTEKVSLLLANFSFDISVFILKLKKRIQRKLTNNII